MIIPKTIFMCNKIKIERVAKFHPNDKKVQLVVFRLTKRDNRPYNFVWIMGNIDKVRYKLFAFGDRQIERTCFGIMYNAQYATDKTRIEVSTTKLRQLCRDLHIKSIVIVRFNIF
jgi:hypothetical protein